MKLRFLWSLDGARIFRRPARGSFFSAAVVFWAPVLRHRLRSWGLNFGSDRGQIRKMHPGTCVVWILLAKIAPHCAGFPEACSAVAPIFSGAICAPEPLAWMCRPQTNHLWAKPPESYSPAFPPAAPNDRHNLHRLEQMLCRSFPLWQFGRCGEHNFRNPEADHN